MPWLRLALALVVLCADPAAADPQAQPQPQPATPPPVDPDAATRVHGEPIVVYGRQDDLVGVAEAASQGTVGAEQLEERPIFRPGEVLETVPGLIVTQHSGEGKANQFFLRGFNLDHGTDFATSIDGVPVNLPSHGHGQGYTDLNPLIPELIERIDFRKGPYYADLGDFSSAGAANIELFRSLPRELVSFQGGMFDYYRLLGAGSTRLGEGEALGALELLYDDGPWVNASRYRKLNALLRYGLGDAANGATVTASAYVGEWDSTDQIAERALDQPGFGRFDTLDSTDGGDSEKISLHGEWHRSGENSASRVLLYGFYQNLDLYSNFTYFLSSPAGDQFEQTDRRLVGGGSARHTVFGRLHDWDMENTIGLQLRSDSIRNGLFQTRNRRRIDKLDYDGVTIPETTRKDDIWELSLAPWIQNWTQWHPKVRSLVGVRLDWFHFDVDAFDPVDSGRDDAVRASPKANLVFGPWWGAELYVSGGMGFHSNDARGVTAPVDPADALVKTYGAEIGLRSTFIEGLHSTIAFWWLDIDSELLFVGDAGETEATRPSRRFGVEIANYWSPTEWLTFDADASLSHARFRDADPAGDHIPGSIESVVAAGASVHDLRGFSAELRLRYFGPRPLVESDDVRSSDVILLTARLAYRITEHLEIHAEVYNLLDRDDSDIEYDYPSRLAGEPPGPDEGGYDDVHFHPIAPISVRAGVTARF
jgi:hypothetical protein